MLFSIVIPCYNVADILERAVNSISDQLEADYEIILIDDNSTDETWELIKKIGLSNKNVKFFQNQTNKGPGFSRNLGILYATGQYIGFLDSDDNYCSGIFNQIKTTIEERKPDIIKFGVRELFSHETRHFNKEKSSSFFYSKKKVDIFLKVIQLELLPLFGYAANSFYRRNLLLNNSIYFPPNLKFYEDFFFNIDVIKKVDSFVFLDFIGYDYDKTRSISLSHNKPHNFYVLSLHRVKSLVSLAEEVNCLQKAKDDLRMLMTRTICSCLVYSFESGSSFRNSFNLLNDFYSDPVVTMLYDDSQKANLVHSILNFILKKRMKLTLISLSYFLFIFKAKFKNLFNFLK